MPYTAKITRDNPTCLVFLLDQSASMRLRMPGGGGLSKAQVLADAVNELLYVTVLRCRKERGEPLFHYFDIALIGYGDKAASLIPGYTLLPVQQIAERNTRTEQDGQIRRPVWFDPIAEGDATAMCAAIEMAGWIVHGWVRSHPRSFPPLVFNLTDGMSTDGDPTVWAERLRGLRTEDGELLMFNINISSLGGPAIRFPATQENLPDDFAAALFRMSSPLPDLMRSFANEIGWPVQPGARGFVYNADVDAIISALDIGTRPLPTA